MSRSTVRPREIATPGLREHLELWHRVTLRHWRQDSWSSILLVLLLSLGVASYLSIRMANREAVGGFEFFHRSLQPQSDWVLRHPSGRLPIGQLVELRECWSDLPITLVPVLESSAARPRAGGAEAAPPVPIRVVGLDLIALGNGNSEDLVENLAIATDRVLATERPAIWITEELAQEWQASVGTELELRFDTRVHALEVVGMLPPRSPAGETPPRLALMDIADLAQAAGEEGFIDRIEVVLPADKTARAKAESALRKLAESAAWTVRSPGEEAAEGEDMTVAFRLNLTVLSLIALLVAIYLIAQALDAVVVRRRQEIATLRSLGMTPRMLKRLWALEFASLGLLGGVGGLLLGWLLAQATAGAVAQTVNQLYFPTDADSWTPLRGSDVLIALLLGLGGSLLAGWLPLRDAAATPPAQVLATGRFHPGFGILQRPLLGLLLIAAGGILWYLPPLEFASGARFPLAGYLCAFLWLIGGTLLLAGLFPLLAKGLQRSEGSSIPRRLARSHLGEATSRHRLAAAGLFVAVTMAGGMSVLVASFAKTMEDWIAVRFQADLFISSASAGGAGQEFLLDEELLKSLGARPEVEAIDPFRVLPLEIDGRRTFLGASRHELLGSYQDALWLDPPRPLADTPENTFPAFVNEAFAARFKIGTGDVVTLPTPTGDRSVWIRGLFADYGNEQGLISIDWNNYERWFGIGSATNVSLFLRSGADPLALQAELETLHPDLAIRDNTTLRTLVRTIFRQTFAITEALKTIGILVALGGLALALGNLLRESRDELRTLRRMGLKRSEIAQAAAWESAGIGLVGLSAGLVASGGLGALLVYVINRQSFGWTLRFALPWAEFAVLFALTLALAGAIGAWVGWRHAKLGGNGS